MTITRQVAALLAAAVTSCALSAGTAAAATTAPAAITPVSTGHSAWGWGSPAPQGQDLSAVAFQGVDGYAVGAFGTILRSGDGGQSWTGLASGSIDDLTLVQELTPTTVIAAGGCSALESTDAGASFTALPLGLGEPCEDPVTGIAFSDADNGYVELQDGTLFATADGGATLEAKSAPPLGGGTATGLAFSSPTTGLAVSSTGLIDLTTDGGNSWTQVESAPEGLNGVTVVSPTLAYAVGDDGELLSSTNGGETWTRLPLVLQGGGAIPDLSSITCADPTDCLIATADSNELVRTADGGQTGAKVSVSNDALTSVAYVAGSTVVGVGALGATVLSDDAGQTFPVITSGGLSAFAPGSGDQLRAGGTPGTAYLPGTTGIAASTDSGTSWSLLRVPTNQAIVDTAFPSAQDGYALDGAGVLRHTTDGGSSWSSFPGQHLASALVAPGARTLLLFGTHGILRSTDGGAEFHEVTGRVLVGSHRGARVSSLGLQSAIAVHGAVIAWRSPDARIDASADGGRTWRSVRLPPHPADADIEVSAISASHLWVYDRGTLWVTTDRGRLWRALPALGRLDSLLDPGLQHGQVSFSSAADGIVSIGLVQTSLRRSPLGQVSVLRTTNGGRTWIPEIVAGNPDADADAVLSTPTGDLAALGTASLLPTERDALGLFTTAGASAPVRRTTLRIGFARRRLSAQALAHAGHHLLVTGHVSPVLSPDETIAVSSRVDGGSWQVTAVRAASSGAFRLHLDHVRENAEIVAQAVGTGVVAGAGTPVARFMVSR